MKKDYVKIAVKCLEGLDGEVPLRELQAGVMEALGLEDHMAVARVTRLLCEQGILFKHRQGKRWWVSRGEYFEEARDKWGSGESEEEVHCPPCTGVGFGRAGVSCGSSQPDAQGNVEGHDGEVSCG